MTHQVRFSWVSALTLLLPLTRFCAGSDAESLFVRRVAPLFHEKCLACHGQDEAKIKGGLDLRTPAATLKGGGCGFENSRRRRLKPPP